MNSRLNQTGSAQETEKTRIELAEALSLTDNTTYTVDTIQTSILLLLSRQLSRAIDRKDTSKYSGAFIAEFLLRNKGVDEPSTIDIARRFGEAVETNWKIQNAQRWLQASTLFTDYC